MKTQDIKNMASAYMQVLEKAKMDKVNPKELEKDFDDREDKDIDNDGDTDKSDEYLHNRRKAVKNAMKKEAKDYGPGHIGTIQKMLDKEREAKKAKDDMKKEAVSNMGKKPSDTQMGTVTVTTDAERAKRAQAYRDKQASMKKEEVEELDEISRDTARSYIRKASAHKTTGETPMKDRSSGVELAGKKAYGIGGKAKVMATESVELGEDISKMSHGRLKFHMNTGTPHGSYSNAEMKAERDRRMKYRDSADAYKKAKPSLSEAKDGDGANIVRDREFKGKSLLGKTPTPYKPVNPAGAHYSTGKNTFASLAKKSMKKEEVEELDELSKKTLGSYIKKATGDAMTKSFRAGDIRDKDSTDNRLKAMSRQMGIAKATNKLTKEEVELGEAAPKIKPDFIKTQREKDRAHDAAMGRTPTGRKKTMTSTQRSMASMRKEDMEIDEAKNTMDTSDMGKWYDKNYPDKKKSKNMSMKEKLQLQKKSVSSEKLTVAIKALEKIARWPDGRVPKPQAIAKINLAAINDMKEEIQPQKESILEREMTDAEKKKREDIVMGMKKNKADLEKRYGSRWKDVMYATATKQAMESVDNALAMTKNLLTTKESFKTETTTWPVYARIKEANDRAKHYKGATPPETMDDKLTASDKAFLAPHGELKGNDSGIDGAKAAEYTAKNATTGIKAGGGMNRSNDQKTGDKNIIKSTEAK